MQKFFSIYILAILLLCSCEEKIDVNLNQADPRLVIEASLSNKDRVQEIKVSRTVSFESSQFDPVLNATVLVTSNSGQSYPFTSVGNGVYRNLNFPINHMHTYALKVEQEGNTYAATGKLSEYVEVDSLGITKETVFNETYYFINLKFVDPPNVPNYYLYALSINDEPFKFNSALNDKYNDGQQVTHQLGAGTETFKPGDKVTIRRQLVSKEVFNFWNEFQSTNPGSAAPGNPKGNISNGALGFFGIFNSKEYTIEVVDAEDLNNLESRK